MPAKKRNAMHKIEKSKLKQSNFRMSSQDESKNIVQGRNQDPSEDEIQQTSLIRQLTDNKWEAAAVFMNDQPHSNTMMTVGTSYGTNGRNTVYVMRKIGETLVRESFTDPSGLQVVNNYGPKEYRQWVKQKLHEEVHTHGQDQ